MKDFLSNCVVFINYYMTRLLLADLEQLVEVCSSSIFFLISTIIYKRFRLEIELQQITYLTAFLLQLEFHNCFSSMFVFDYF